ncbi:hypothetical protein ColLi_00570 [Colletotrichum liriopes]|uniref:BTB domain-containing protein n=1 Tax=Colletotrichum liriopes TaxID=708192 RepID=A0AA37GBX8_9PEZI|nr:hypothetical protein ColLi_00570 [Colletotrichum liriopes]
MNGVNLSHLFATGEYSDLTINASGVIFKAHRCIVFPQFLNNKNRQLVLKGPKVTQAILEYMYSGTYIPVKIRCRLKEPSHTASDNNSQPGESSAVTNDAHDHLNAPDSNDLSYDDHTCVMTKANEYKMKDLETQAKNALLAVAPSLTDHAEFICAIEHILGHYQDDKGLGIVLQMVNTKSLKSLSMRRRFQAVMRSYPHLAVELLEPLILELNRHEDGHAPIAQGQKNTINREPGALSLAAPGLLSTPVQPAASSTHTPSLPQGGAVTPRKRMMEEELLKLDKRSRRTGN